MENKIDLSELKRIDLVSFAKAHGFSGSKKKKSSQRYVYLERSDAKISITRKGLDYVYTEMVLGVGGSIIDFCINFVDGCRNVGLAIEYIKKNYGISRGEGSIPVASEAVGMSNNECFLDYLELNCVMLTQANDYLKLRGLGTIDYTNHNVYWVRNFYGNVVFPLFMKNEVCGILERNVKYCGMHKNSINGLWHSYIEKHYRQILITESPIDNFSYQLLNPDEWYFHVSTCGANSVLKTQYFVELCKKLALPVIIGFDNDLSGKNMTNRLAQVLDKENIPYRVDIPFYKDFNEDLTLEK